MAFVFDYSAARPSGSALNNAGVTGVVRYAGALTSSVNLSRDELEDLTAHGIPVGVVSEQRVDDVLGGRAKGAAMATAAVATCQAAGLPEGLVYVAGDSDLTLGGPTSPGSPGDQQMQKVADTITGFADVLGWSRVGFYGSHFAIDWLITHELQIAAYWQTEAWSRGLIHPHAALLQRARSPQGTPAGCDYND